MGAEEIKKDMDISSWPSDLAYEQWVALPVSNARPSARYKHAAVMVDEKLYITGGSRNGRYLSDFQVFDLRCLTWSSLKLKIEPNADKSKDSGLQEVLPGTSDHSMMEWSQPQIRGDLVIPRAGHAGTSIDEMWYIVGGGDNSNGCLETLALNMSKLVWSTLTTLKERHPLASEGLSVCSAVIDGEKHLVAFGGYNGKYSNEELQSVQGQLISERSRCFKLEAQIAELQKMLESLPSIEKEVQILRRQKSALEQEMELAAAQRQGSGGVWRWIAGGT